MDISAIQKRLNQVAVELQAISRMLSETEGEFPASKQADVDAGICLNCGLPLASKKTRAIRGCHESCYREIMREVESGTLTENEAVSQGLLLPAAGGGRPAKRTRVKELVADKLKSEAKADVAELEAAIKAKRKKGNQK